MTMQHPAAWIGHLDEQLDRLSGLDERSVLPNAVGRGQSISGYDEETLSVDVNGVCHCVKDGRIVDDAHPHEVAASESPEHVHVLAAGPCVAHDPPHLV